MALSQVVARPETAEVSGSMEREKAVDPTTACTWSDTWPGETIGSDRCCVKGAQLIVQTLEADTNESEVRIVIQASVMLDIIVKDI